MRDSFIFYRSFYEAIKELPRDVQGEIYTAIMEYSLYGKETDDLKPIARSIFTLIKPQIDINAKRFENGCKGGRPAKSETKPKPSNNQSETKPKPNDNVNDNVNDKEKESTNVDKKEPNGSASLSKYDNFLIWIETNTPYCHKHLKPISEVELMRLLNKYKYTEKQITDAISGIENRKDLRKKYANLYRTVLNWLKPKDK